MDAETVKTIFQAAQDEVERELQTRFRYSVAAALRQLAAKQEKKLAIERELSDVSAEIESIEGALAAAHDGNGELVDRLNAMRGGGDQCCKEPGTMNRAYPPESAPRVNVNVHGERDAKLNGGG